MPIVTHAKILWLSGSDKPPVPRQEAMLRWRYGGGCRIDHDNFLNSKEVTKVFREGRYTDIVAVVPHSVIEQLLEEGLPVLWCQAERERNPNLIEWWVGRDGYRFDRFMRVREARLDVQPITPRLDGTVRRVVRVTHHDPKPEELQALREVFGPEVDVQTVAPKRGKELTASDVIVLAREAEANEVVLVAPYPVYQELVNKKDRRPLRALYRDEQFVELQRVHGFILRLEELPPL